MKWNTFIREYNGDIDNVIKKVKLQHHTLDENPSISAHVDVHDAPHTIVSKASASIDDIL